MMKDSSWVVFVLGMQLNRQHWVYRGDDITNMLDKVRNGSICAGNGDEKFKNIEVGATSNAMKKDGIIRHTECEYLMESKKDRCSKCQLHRSTLRKQYNRLLQKEANVEARTDVASKSQLFSLSKAELELKCKKLLAELNSKNSSTTVSPVILDSQVSHDIKTTAMENLPPEGTLNRLFIEEQLKAFETDKRGMRWHPMIIRWAMTIRHRSKSAYEILRETGFMRMPSERTLNDYFHHRQYDSGIDFEGLMDFSKDHQGKDFSLMFDEMKIKDGIMYSRSTGEMTGYVDMGELNIGEEAKGDGVATHALVFMIRGIQQASHFPAATFFTKACTASQLYFMIQEVISYLEMIKLKVRVVISDGASTNRQVAKLFCSNQSIEENMYRAINNFSDTPRFLYFVSDVPHLVKTSRNNVENSHGHLKTRNLVVSTIIINLKE